MKMHSTENKFVIAIGQSEILFADVYVCTFQPGNVIRWGSEGVNYQSNSYALYCVLNSIL